MSSAGIEVLVALEEQQFKISRLNNVDHTVRPIIRADIKQWLNANCGDWGYQLAYGISQDLSDPVFNFERHIQAWIVFDDYGKAMLFRLAWAGL